MGAAKQQMEESASFVTAETLAPEKSFLVFCHAGKRKKALLGCINVYKRDFFSFLSQAEAVFLGDFQHFPPQVFTGFGENDGTGERDGPLIRPLNLVLKVELGNNRRKKKIAYREMTFFAFLSMSGCR